MNTGYQGDSIAVEDITVIGERVPVGRYECKLISCEGKDSKALKPMVQATWEVVKGDKIYQEITIFYSLAVTEKVVKGKLRKYASGVADMAGAFAIVGQPLPAGFQMPLDKTKAANLYAKVMRDKIVDIAVTAEEYETKDDDGNPTGEKRQTTRAKIVKKQAPLFQNQPGQQTAPAVTVTSAATPFNNPDPFAGL